MENSATIGAVVLAAGFARRFGSDKRQYKLANGEPMLLTTTRIYSGVFAEVVVVIREDDADIINLIEQALPQVQIVLAPLAHLGMGHSLASGAIFGKRQGWRGMFLALADMPFIESNTLVQLQAQLSKQAKVIVQPRLIGSGEAGHPVGFSGDWFDELAKLTGDQGARGLIKTYPHYHRYFDTKDSGIVKDMDYPASADHPSD